MSRAHGSTGREELPSETAMRVGDVQGRFDEIRIVYEYQDDGVARLRQFAASQAVRQPGRPYDGAALIAEFGTGKSELLLKLAKVMATDARPGTTPVLLAEIPTNGSIDKVPNAILTALGDLRPDAGRPDFRWQKAIRRIREVEVRLLAVDELDRATTRPTMSKGIANVLREKIMDAGVAPIVFAGTSDAETLLLSCDALYDRLKVQIPLEPLDWDADGDKEVAREMLDAIDRRLQADRLTKGPSNLKGMAEDLVHASDGRMRKLMAILRAGLGVAATRNARSIARTDLAIGWEDLPRRDRTAVNPFRGGCR